MECKQNLDYIRGDDILLLDQNQKIDILAPS